MPVCLLFEKYLSRTEFFILQKYGVKRIKTGILRKKR
jgi:hypothetical protein